MNKSGVNFNPMTNHRTGLFEVINSVLCCMLKFKVFEWLTDRGTGPTIIGVVKMFS